VPIGAVFGLGFVFVSECKFELRGIVVEVNSWDLFSGSCRLSVSALAPIIRYLYILNRLITIQICNNFLPVMLVPVNQLSILTDSC
jgi:hypothetical protein